MSALPIEKPRGMIRLSGRLGGLLDRVPVESNAVHLVCLDRGYSNFNGGSIYRLDKLGHVVAPENPIVAFRERSMPVGIGDDGVPN